MFRLFDTQSLAALIPRLSFDTLCCPSLLIHRSVEMSMATASNIHIELPTSDDFANAELAIDDEGIKKVEG